LPARPSLRPRPPPTVRPVAATAGDQAPPAMVNNAAWARTSGSSPRDGSTMRPARCRPHSRKFLHGDHEPPPAFCRETASWRQRHRFCGCGSDAGWRVVGAPQRDAPRVTRIAALFNPAMATFAEFWLKPFKAAASTAAVRGQHWRISCDDASMLLTAQESRSHRFLFIEVTNTC
jgi:hypothetical protein